MGRWWRRNRGALLALPFVLVLAAGAGSYRVWNFWSPYELTDPVAGRSQEPVRFTHTLEDGSGPYTVDLTVTAADPVPAEHFTDQEGMMHYFPRTEGSRVWRTDLSVEADPGSPLTGCQVRLVDGRGRTTLYRTGSLGGEAVFGLPSSPCVPAATPGPSPDFGLGLDGTAQARPATYTVPVYVRTARDFVPERIEIWWQTPRHLSITVEPEETG
ncbi:hypothetical protein [Ornithinimicrobium cerasi]|uniref:Uncharacterized protein n=1 Tax=Ornithinimicrobium cerasi TaxID=2248773 RepID=A0A285VWU0_9MICO|nr:hypothetical protein [Ornithinimicrobium cerasi]SOC58423.1 hypothetical protein SAMN05421879_1376 [Ornithinimicrobium cerasi]